MKTWLNINQPTILPKSYDAIVAVLSQMKQKAGTFSAQRLEKGIAYTWTELEVDIVKQYHPTARQNWARQKLWKLKQGNTQSSDYVDLFTKYFKDAGIRHSYAIDILEQNMNAEIISFKKEKDLALMYILTLSQYARSEKSWKS